MYSNPPANPLPHIDYRWVILASFLLSAWLIFLDPLVNRDAIIYLRAADAYLQDGFAASQELFGRPILSILMAWLHQLTGIPMVYAGLAITAFFYAAMCAGFVSIVHILGGDRTVQVIAAIVILSHPLLNTSRSSILRDPAYWALLILAFRELLLYLRNPALHHQLRWFAYVMLAALFRFEGIFVAVFAPLALLFARDLPQCGRHFLRLWLPPLLATGAALAAFLAYQLNARPDDAVFPSINTYLERLAELPEQFSVVAADTAQPLLEFTSREDASVAVVAALLAILLLNIGRAATWVWIVTLAYGLRARLLERLRRDDATLLLAHALIILAYLAAFVLINRFMLERYTKPLVVFLLLCIPFILSVLWHAGGWRRVIVILLLAGMSADTLHNNHRDKIFVREATEWVRENTPADSVLVTNEKYIAYFSEREVNWPVLQGIQFRLEDILDNRQLWRRSDYLVMYLKDNRLEAWQAWLEEHSLEELRSFESGRKGRVSIVALERADE